MKTKYFVKVFPRSGTAQEVQIVVIFQRRKPKGGYLMVYHPDMSVYEELSYVTHEWATLLGAQWLAQGFERKVLVDFNFDFEPNTRFILVDFNSCDMKHIIAKEEK